MQLRGMESQALRRGRTTPEVQRIGHIVKRTANENAAFVHELLRFLERAGFDGAPASLGFDQTGRHLLTFIPGGVPHRKHAFSDEAVIKAAELLRRFHDATARCPLKGSEEVVIHGDAGPHKMVFADGVPVALIDWDEAKPGRRLQDIADAVWGFTNLAHDGRRPGNHVQRIRLFCTAYGGADPVAAVSLIEQDVRRAWANHTAAGRLTPASVFVPLIRWFDRYRAELLESLSPPGEA